MKINANQLNNQLKQNIAPLYWVSGDEELLVQESCDLIRSAAKKSGIEEREVYHVDNSFNWDQIMDANQAMSLFGDRKLIEIRMSGKANEPGKTCLQWLANNPNPDNTVLIIGPKIEAAQTKTKWFKAVESQCQWLPIWPIERHQLPAWLATRAKQKNLLIDQAGLTLLCEKVDGNLLAAQQEIEKLALLNEGQVGVDDVMNAVADSARYDIFDLSDAVLQGDVRRSLRTLHGLKGEGSEPTVILWALSRELRLLAMLKQGEESGQPMAALFKQHRIWDKRQGAYLKAIKAHQLTQLHDMIRFSGRLDHIIKGQIKADIWKELEVLVFAWVNPQGMNMLQMVTA